MQECAECIVPKKHEQKGAESDIDNKPNQKPGKEVTQSAYRESQKNGSVDMARHLQSLHLEDGIGQCYEADGTTCQVALEDESTRYILEPEPWCEFHNDHAHKTELRFH